MIQLELTTTEHQELQKHEAIIERGLTTFVEVGQSLMAIRDGRLYRDDYGTFEDYCRERWGFSRMRASQLISAAEVVGNVNRGLQIPTNERQTRPLSQLPPAQQAEAWQQAVETAPNGKPTAAHVQDVVKSFDYKRDTKAARPADIYEPKGYDACQTPAYAIDPLLPYLQPGWQVWEPAAGEGNLVEAFYDAGFSVTDSDILTGQNFFDHEPVKWDCLVTNPPYSIKYDWLKRCYELGKPFALLVPVETIGAQAAQNLFKQYGVELMLLNRRVNFKMPNKGWEGGGAQFPVLWLCWHILPKEINYGEIINTDELAG
jgi:hypothetical protein